MKNKTKQNIFHATEFLLGIILVVTQIVFWKSAVSLDSLFQTTTNGISLQINLLPYLVITIVALSLGFLAQKYFGIKMTDLDSAKQLPIEDEMENLNRIRFEANYFQVVDSLFISISIVNLMLANVLIPSYLVGIVLTSLFSVKALIHLILINK
jgi:hypothetical protein